MVTTTVATAVTMIATMIAFYYGKHLGNKASVETIVDSMLTRLEKDGFIKTQKNEKGEVELISIKDLTKDVLQSNMVLRVGIKVGWPRVKVPNIMVWGCKFPALNFKLLER